MGLHWHRLLRKYIPIYQPTKRRSILEDIAHLPPASPCEDATASPKPPTPPPPPATPTLNNNTTTPLQSPANSPPISSHTPWKDTTPPTTPTRNGIEVNVIPLHIPDSRVHFHPPQPQSQINQNKKAPPYGYTEEAQPLTIWPYS